MRTLAHSQPGGVPLYQKTGGDHVAIILEHFPGTLGVNANPFDLVDLVLADVV